MKTVGEDCVKINTLAYRRADGLETMRAEAAKRGGACLATEYVGNNAYYRFRCEHGHEWETNAARIFRGSWCPKCQNKGNVYGIADMRRIASAHGGRCLSRAYKNSLTKLEWECAHGHRWWTMPESIVAGKWCCRCAYDARKLSIEDMHAVATERGGLRISTEYVNVSTKLEWECHIGHRWFAKPNTIRNWHRCRLCAYLAMTRDPKTIRKRRHLPGKRWGGKLSATMTAGENDPAWTTPHPICLKNYAAITNRNLVCWETSSTGLAESIPGPQRG